MKTADTLRDPFPVNANAGAAGSAGVSANTSAHAAMAAGSSSAVFAPSEPDAFAAAAPGHRLASLQTSSHDDTAPAYSCRENRAGHRPGVVLHALIGAGLDHLGLPGHGKTLLRWRALAAVAARDLSLVKLYEGHTDAKAILAEATGVDGSVASVALSGGAWGVWCAEQPDARLSIVPDPGGEPGYVRISGVKAWCSGAAELNHALVSGWNAGGEPCLAAVDFRQSGIRVTRDGWSAVGMVAAASVDVHFDSALGRAIGPAGFYTARPGFWHGGAGIAACWYGAAAGLADAMRLKLARENNPHALAHLGAADVALSSAAASLRKTAQWIDEHPDEDARLPALRLRMIVENGAEAVLIAAGRAMGVAAFSRDPATSRVLADLPVFLRQSHAEQDLAALGSLLLEGEDSPWTL
jgi:hypothetical protein